MLTDPTKAARIDELFATMRAAGLRLGYLGEHLGANDGKGGWTVVLYRGVSSIPAARWEGFLKAPFTPEEAIENALRIALASAPVKPTPSTLPPPPI